MDINNIHNNPLSPNSIISMDEVRAILTLSMRVANRLEDNGTAKPAVTEAQPATTDDHISIEA